MSDNNQQLVIGGKAELPSTSKECTELTAYDVFDESI
jgi:hypothetical protein